MIVFSLLLGAVLFILDMMRAATNVWGDVVGTVVISRAEGERAGKLRT